MFTVKFYGYVSFCLVYLMTRNPGFRPGPSKATKMARGLVSKI